MDVKFTNTTAAKLSSLAVTNGQLVAVSDGNALYYDLGGVRRAAYVHPTGAGYNHIPAGGLANTVLVYSSAGVAKWAAIPAHASASAVSVGAGTGTAYGHVRLSDNYTSSAGAASSGVGASSLAVYNAYNTLNTKLSNVAEKVTTYFSSFSCDFFRIGHMRFLSWYGTQTDNFQELMINFTPSHNLSVPIVISYKGSFFTGYVCFKHGDGWYCYYYTPGSGTANNPASGCKLFGQVMFDGIDQ